MVSEACSRVRHAHNGSGPECRREGARSGGLWRRVPIHAVGRPPLTPLPSEDAGGTGLNGFFAFCSALGGWLAQPSVCEQARPAAAAAAAEQTTGSPFFRRVKYRENGARRAPFPFFSQGRVPGKKKDDNDNNEPRVAAAAAGPRKRHVSKLGLVTVVWNSKIRTPERPRVIRKRPLPVLYLQDAFFLSFLDGRRQRPHTVSNRKNTLWARKRDYNNSIIDLSSGVRHFWLKIYF